MLFAKAAAGAKEGGADKPKSSKAAQEEGKAAKAAKRAAQVAAGWG